MGAGIRAAVCRIEHNEELRLHGSGRTRRQRGLRLRRFLLG
jgi:hypothetical protein